MNPRAGQFRLEPASARIERDGGADVHATRANGSKVHARDIDQLHGARHACRDIRGRRRSAKNSVRNEILGRQQSRCRRNCDRVVDGDSPIVCSEANSRRPLRLESQADAEGIRTGRLQVRVAARAPDRQCKFAVSSRICDRYRAHRRAACRDRRAAAGGSFGQADVRRVSADVGRQISAYSGLKVWPTSE